MAVRGALVFIASHSPANANWLGRASPEAVAQQVARAVGPSGPNWEYVYRLAAALREVRVPAGTRGGDCKLRPVAVLPAGARAHASKAFWGCWCGKCGMPGAHGRGTCQNVLVSAGVCSFIMGGNSSWMFHRAI